MALNINPKFCKGCGICVAFCPKHILELDERGKIMVTDPEKCINCGQCELRCPDFAIKVVGPGRGEKNG
jgi:2-oxoglutarate ferredoxin oxidoreductase subunit delta